MIWTNVWYKPSEYISLNGLFPILNRILDAKNGKGGVEVNGKAEEADVTLEATDSDLYDILTGKLDAKKAYVTVSVVHVITIIKN